MKIFIDSANIDEIRTAYSWGIIDGVTTNPTLISKEGIEFKELVLKICEIVDGPISVEAISTKSSDIIPEAEALAQLHPNIVVKIPMTTEGLKAIKILSKKDVKTNCTLVFSVNQALFAAKAGATYTSPFIGRLDDIGHHGMGLIKDILTVYKNYNFKTQVIVASVRHPMHMVEAALLGADIATAPYKVLEFMTKHPLTDIGIERFLKDWSKVKK